ncbi:PAS domain S-box protein [Allomyces macrogynus ATCC 38327]|uniref:PAS domain S-box protein n=1 Tax=Allomyces macrogynus (strain ATCC 38327) TaxID=578462 RepID=A0A0L0SRU2_ALLM3|nr:PAS domain S-box protein [Allomyces macrogynus ATCC 38327]|eukprot:KNE65201.1 PAS domain S-box protein [Allomyces macrogynus ATCC 38327]
MSATWPPPPPSARRSMLATSVTSIASGLTSANDRPVLSGRVAEISEDEAEQTRRWTRIALAAAAVVVLAGIGCAVGLFFVLRAVEMDKYNKNWASLCEENVRLLDVAFNLRLTTSLLNVAAYVHAVPKVSQGMLLLLLCLSRQPLIDNLVTFTQHSSFDRTLLYSISNAPVFSYDDIPKFEARYGTSLWPQPLPPKELVLVHGRPIASPVLFIYPPALIRSITGFNQFSNQQRRDALLALLRSPTMRLSISDPIGIIPTNARGFIVWVKAMNRTMVDPDTPFSQWIAAATIEVSTLLKSSLGSRSAERGVYVDVIHPTGELVFTTVPINLSKDDLDAHNYTIPVLNQHWPAVCWASPRFYKSMVTAWPIVVGVILLVFFLFAAEFARCAILRYIAAKHLLRRYQIQDQLLSTLSRYSKAIIEALPDCLLVVNAHGRILGINEAVLDVTGYSVAELEAMPIAQIVFPKLLDLGLHASPVSTADDTLAPDGTPTPQTPAAAPRAVDPASRAGFVSPSRATDGRTPAMPPPPSSSRSQRVQITDSAGTTTAVADDADDADASASLLEVGFFEGTVRRKDGTSFPASISVNAAGDAMRDGDPRAIFDHAVEVGMTPLSQSRSGDTVRVFDTAIAQVVLFHDISDQMHMQRAAAAAKRDEREATRSKESLLRFLARSLFPQTLSVHAALRAFQRYLHDLGIGVGLVGAGGGVGSTTCATSLASSSASVFEEIDAAEATARHMVLLMEDLALFIGTPFPARYAEQTPGTPLRTIMQDGLDARKDVTGAKRMAITKSVDPANTVIGGELTQLRLLVAKMLFLGSSIRAAGLDFGSWQYTITKRGGGTGAPAGPASPAPSSTASTGSSSASASFYSIVSGASPDGRCRQRRAPAVAAMSPPMPMPPGPERMVPLSIHLRQRLSAMDKALILDDLELSLTHGSSGSEFGNLALTYLGLAKFVKRIGGMLGRSADPVTGSCTLDVEVRCTVGAFVATSRVGDFSDRAARRGDQAGSETAAAAAAVAVSAEGAC